MCTVSMVGDGWRDQFPGRWPNIPKGNITELVSFVSKAEFEALKKEVEELKVLLKAAKKFDEATGQPHCEMDDKVALIKAVAKAVGVNMDEVFKRNINP